MHDLTSVVQGMTALHLAAKRGHPELVDILLSHGADVTAQDAEARKPLCAASLKNHLICRV